MPAPSWQLFCRHTLYLWTNLEEDLPPAFSRHCHLLNLRERFVDGPPISIYLQGQGQFFFASKTQTTDVPRTCVIHSNGPPFQHSSEIAADATQRPALQGNEKPLELLPATTAQFHQKENFTSPKTFLDPWLKAYLNTKFDGT